MTIGSVPNLRSALFLTEARNGFIPKPCGEPYFLVKRTGRRKYKVSSAYRTTYKHTHFSKTIISDSIKHLLQLHSTLHHHLF
jgi:hypothetical protein